MAEFGELEKLVVQIHGAGQAWIDSKLAADQLDRDEKNFLAMLMNALEDNAKEKLAESKLERLARGSKDYRDYVTRMCIAKAEAQRKQVRYENLQALWETKRSELTFERAKIEKGIFHQGR